MNPITIDMVQGDAGPGRTFSFVRTDGSIPNLAGCTVNFFIYHPITRVQTNASGTSCMVVSPTTNGQAIYEWGNDDIPDAGVYGCKAVITGLSSGSPESALITLQVAEDPAID